MLSAASIAAGAKGEEVYGHLEDHKTPNYSATGETYQTKSPTGDEPHYASNGGVNAAGEGVNYYKPKEPRPSAEVFRVIFVNSKDGLVLKRAKVNRKFSNNCASWCWTDGISSRVW